MKLSRGESASSHRARLADSMSPADLEASGSRRVYLPLLLLIALIGLGLRCWDIDKPFAFGERGSSEWYGFDNGAFYGVGALNMRRFGYIDTRFACVLKSAVPGRLRIGPDSNRQPFFYVRHPPLLTVALSVMFSLFGASHIVARILPIALSMVALLGVARLAHRLWGHLAALTAALVMAILPAGSFYGSLVDPQGSLVMGFSVLACDAYVTILRKPGNRRALIALFGWLALACLSDWPGYFVAGLLAVHQIGLLATAPSRQLFAQVLRRCAALALLVIALFTLHMAQTASVGGSKQGGMVETLQHHSLIGLSRQQAGGLGAFLVVCGHSVATLLGVPGALFGAAGLVLILRPGARRQPVGTCVAGILAGMALLHILIFAEAARRHLYWFVYLLPPTALGVAALCARLTGSRLRARGRPVALVSRLIALGLLALTLGLGLRQSLSMRFEPDPYFMQLGRVIQRETTANHWVLTSEFPQISLRFYADRWIQGKLSDDRLVAVTDMDAFVKRLRESLPHDEPVVFILPEQPSYPERRCEQIQAALERHFPSRLVESPIGPVWIYTLRD